MSNIYINRNRSQGNYAFDLPGNKLKQQDQHPIFNTTQQTWVSRASVEKVQKNDQRFNRTSTKYGKNPIQQESYVGVPWSIIDSCQTVRQSKDLLKQKAFEEAGLWKKYSNYDTMNPHERYRNSVKESLKNEINNIAMDLAIKREASYLSPKLMSPKTIRDQFNSTYNRSNSNWKSPKVESIERNFNEGSRFFSCKEGREHGLKFVSKPLADCNLQELKEEARRAEEADRIKEMQSTLLNDFYTYQPSSTSKQGKNKERYNEKNLSQLMHKADQESKMRQTQESNYQQLFADRSVQKGQKFGGSRRFETNTDAQALQYMNSTTTHGRILKFADQIIRFPKKERFNQDLNESVREIKKQINDRGPKSLTVQAMAGRNLELQSQFDGRSKRSSQRSKFSTISKISTLTKEELQKYFKDKKDQMDEDSKSRITAISQGQFLKIQQRRMSVANKKVRDLTESISPDREQYRSIGFQSPNRTEEVEEAEEVEEISYHSDGENDIDIDIDIDQTKDQTFPLDGGIETQDGYATNENTQDEILQDFDGFEDKDTNITEQSKETKFSATAEKEIENLMQKIDQEKSQRQQLQHRIQDMKDKAAQQDKQCELNQNNQFSLKLLNQDQRNLMQSAQNYTTHCDFS